MGLGDEERPEHEQVHHVLSPSVQHKPLHVSGGSVNSGLGVHSPIYFNLTATLCITIVFGGENGVHSRGADWNTHLPPQASTLSTCRELSSRAAGLAQPVSHSGSRWSWTEQEPAWQPSPWTWPPGSTCFCSKGYMCPWHLSRGRCGPFVPITREPKETNYRCVTRGFLSELVPGPS